MSFSFRIDVAAALQGIERLNAEILSVARQSLRQAASHAVTLARQTTTFKDRTGNLRASIRFEDRGLWDYRAVAGGVGSRATNRKGAQYALFVEEGTRPHAIEARRAKALRFVMNGEIIFRRRVWHPGTKATNFMRDARDEAERTMVMFLEDGLGRAIAA
jgi:Bacteriophage HK97-gp10, putative tail-component